MTTNLEILGRKRDLKRLLLAAVNAGRPVNPEDIIHLGLLPEALANQVAEASRSIVSVADAADLVEAAFADLLEQNPVQSEPTTADVLAAVPGMG